ncbi:MULTISPECIES: glycosyltransferase family 2 protein [Mycobacterium]|uniref:Glycosyltransferase 2-like domain-containing protein n=1 Tax=Mycobacterium gordonae TaxID=1778 RepID=A0A1A6BLN0_MYCGO|nr:MULTISPECIES: glycosyltransferase family 2 protein [Mycobacterium]OBS03262.1 hypothetical protein A9W98_10485 [Mycobacterium gordonae]ODR21743.1 hypothetical protein BHQ23_11365 [Mycobacterium gordonae]ORV86509.1 hypothetical protein AWC08_24745 [Mycobacterium gordonae]
MPDNDIESKPTVSVCVPMYNNSATIERCLRSILDQDGVDFEIVVVDDDSTDDCAAAAAALLRPQDRLVRNAPRLGLNGNHNRCLEVARGELIQFVHGDDWLLPGALRTLASCFDNAEVGMAFAPRKVETDDQDFRRQYGVLHTHFKGLQAHNRGRSLVRQMAARGALHNWIGEPTCVMFRRRLALDAGGFRDDVYQLVDLDIWYRLMLRSSVGFVPQELSVRTHTATTESARNLSMRRYWLDQLRILTWLTLDPASSASVRTLAALWWLPAWLSLLQAVVWGPQRWSSLKTFSQAPFREIARARRFRRALAPTR